MTQIRSDQFTITRCQFSKGLNPKNETTPSLGPLSQLSNSIFVASDRPKRAVPFFINLFSTVINHFTLMALC